jgi:hypothetical protein
VPQRVALSIAVTGTNTLLLSWPTNSVNSFPYVLQEKTDLDPGTWIAVTNVPVYAGGTNRIILPVPPATHFYQLKTP